MADSPFNPFADGIAAEATLTQAERQQVAICTKRAKATANNRAAKREEVDAALDSVDGDREALCRIHVWERLDPNNEEDAKLIRSSKYEPEEFMFAALDRKLKFEIGNDERQAMTDMSAANTNVQYKLVPHLVPRARHFDEEVAFAKMQGRFREQKHHTATFFADPTVRVRKDRYQPLGSFEWCDRDENATQANAITRAQRLEASLRKIRNVKESLA